MEQLASLKDGLTELEAEIKEIKSVQSPDVLTPDTARDDELTAVNGAITELEERLSRLLDNVENQVMYMQNYMSTLNSTIVSEKVERFRIESNLQAQVNQVLDSLASFKERISALEQVVPDV
ncbi:hypothetical protein ElyMa_000468500 [Elysia marginata]|uniref:Uncharacterized protein n=1 Tax=Elysia marginata TaxID=1093978 RepID=A0AAV4FRH3_9GAST|nr:hypothetical protein ElyMa_000468500 [Elysia marginata]